MHRTDGPTTPRSLRLSLGSVALALSVASAAFAACTSASPGNGTSATSATPEVTADKPTLRLYLLSTVAGALEPCGCSKDQLGGADHLAAYLASQQGHAKDTLVLAAGPFLFQDPVLSADKRTQSEWKAEALAKAAAKIGLAAWAPGANDWAAGADVLASHHKTASASLVAANLAGVEGIVPSKVVEVAGVKIGIVGLSEPGSGATIPANVKLSPSLDALKKEVAAVRAQGARIVVALAAVPRGDALRLVETVTDVDVLVVGKPLEKGDLNDAPKPAVLIGDTLVVETSNHLQTVGVVDLHLRDVAGTTGRVKLTDAGGVAKTEELLSLSARIRELEHRINGWEKDKQVNRDDLAARKADLERLRGERARLEGTTEPPASGSFFRYSLVEVREKLGQDKAVADIVLDYYKRVNDHNKVAFKDRVPTPAPEGESSYVGVEACTTCHREERAVWDKTDHARAYATLQKTFVEYNLECVGCHVTGYDRPGGSTVTHVEKLVNVGCEVCHGPGSRHGADPEKKGLIVQKPEPRSCVSECHHPPHVEGFDPVAKMQHVLGPGHGM